MKETNRLVKPIVTIIMVSDYAGGEEKSWNDLRKAFHAWAAQDFNEFVDFVLVESSIYKGKVPDDLFGILSTCRVLFDDAKTSYGLKNAAVQASETEFVGIVDADCIPNKQWIRLMMKGLRRDESIAAISGVTTYPERNRMERILGLLGRSYIDPGREGKTRFISGNAAGFRRADYLQHPLLVNLGAFSSRLQSEAMIRDGRAFYFDPEMATIHDFEGWPMEQDVRRNQGYCTIVTRLHDPLMPFAWLVRLGPVSIPAVVVGKMLLNFADVFRCASHYNVHWYELPIALGLSIWTHLMEIPGMLAAYRRESVGETAYR